MKSRDIRAGFGTEITPSHGETVFDLDRDALIGAFRASGALLFRRFELTPEQFDGFARLFGKEFMNYRGGGYVRRRIDGNNDEMLLSVNYDHGRETQHTFALPLHGEMYYLDHRPAALWFYCLVPAAQDGETTICDGCQIYDALSPATKELLARRRLKFSRTYRDGEWQKIYQTTDIEDAVAFARWNGLNVQVDESRTLRTHYVIPPVMTSRWGSRPVYINTMMSVVWQEREIGRGDTSIVRFDDGAQIPNSLIDEVVAVQRELVVPIGWEAGDCVFIDNSRTLHGRRAFTDTRRELYLRMVRALSFS